MTVRRELQILSDERLFAKITVPESLESETVWSVAPLLRQAALQGAGLDVDHRVVTSLISYDVL